MKSLRNQMTSTLLIGQFVVLVSCGSVLYLYVHHTLVMRFDDNLLVTARTFAAMSEKGDEEDEDGFPERASTIAETGEHVTDTGDFDSEFSEAKLAEFQPSPHAEYYQVWEEDGEVISRSPSLGVADLHIPGALGGDHQFFDLILPDGRRGRAVSLVFELRVETAGDGVGKNEVKGLRAEHLVVVIARSRENVDRDLEILLTGLLFVGALLVTCTVILVRWTVSRGLQPLDAVAQQAKAIDVRNLSDRFPTQSLPVELLPISQRLNELLQRLESSFRRENRFTSDVAHELRTPIAELRALTEVGLRSMGDPIEPEELAFYFQDALAIATQMESLCTTLLALARCESDQQRVDYSQSDVVAIVKEAWRAFEKEAYNKELIVNFVLPVVTILETDRALLTAIVSNLLSNAVTYTPAGGRIAVTVTDGEKQPLLSISNQNDELTNEDLTHIFEPFWRKDRSRTDSSHLGVGFAVVAAFSELLGMKVSVELPQPDQFNVSITTRAVITHLPRPNS